MVVMIEIPDSFYVAFGLGILGGLACKHIANPLVDGVYNHVGHYQHVISLARKMRQRADKARQSGPSELEVSE